MDFILGFIAGDDIKLEPISPLANSPQPLSPYENTSSLIDVKSEMQVHQLDSFPNLNQIWISIF